MDDNQGMVSPEQENELENTQSEQEEQPRLSPFEVRKIVQREKEAAIAKAKRDAEMEYQQKLEEANRLRGQQAERNEQVPRAVDADEIYKQVQERIQADMHKQQFEQEMQNVANNYLSKMDVARKQYEDFDKVTASFNAARHPQLVYLLSGLENGGDVMYELSKNRSKLMDMIIMSREEPEMAHEELLSLAASINRNRQAQAEAQQYDTPPPLERLNRTNSTSGSVPETVSDFRRLDWLRR